MKIWVVYADYTDGYTFNCSDAIGFYSNEESAMAHQIAAEERNKELLSLGYDEFSAIPDPKNIYDSSYPDSNTSYRYESHDLLDEVIK